MATTSAILAITSAKKGNTPMAHLLVQLMINVVIQTTTTMAITSAKQG